MHLRTDTSANSHYSQVPTIRRPRNAFTVAKKHVTTIQFDYLYPMYWQYIYPGDTLSGQFKAMARLQTQIRTLFDDLYLDLHAWFVPFRLIQTNWARYQFNAQPTGPTQDNSSLTSPKITLSGLGAGGFVAKSLYDYLGFPTEVDLSADVEHINNYLARAYSFIWNNDYRDENLQNAVTVDLDDGPDDPADYALRKRGKRHDKFTSALPFQQKGTAATLPLGTSAPIYYNTTVNNPMLMRSASSYNGVGATNVQTSASSQLQTSGGVLSFLDPNGMLYADLSSATAATVNQLRTSVAVQHLLEADARGGTRDVESIQHRWGVTVPDFRLQRPEFIGGATFSFDGHVVPQTSATSGTDYLADLAQFSQAMVGLPVNHSFVEHGVFMILLSCRSNMTYQQGLPRELSYRTRYDWYQPEFANLGEVAIKNKEIYMSSNNTDNNATFGYQEYGYELRYQDNMVTGEMRSNYATSLDSYHMAYDFSSLPTLGDTFIQSNTPISRNIAVSAATADPVQLNSMFQGKIARTLPMFSVPGLTRL